MPPHLLPFCSFKNFLKISLPFLFFLTGNFRFCPNLGENAWLSLLVFVYLFEENVTVLLCHFLVDFVGM